MTVGVLLQKLQEVTPQVEEGGARGKPLPHNPSPLQTEVHFNQKAPARLPPPTHTQTQHKSIEKWTHSFCIEPDKISADSL